MLALALYLHWQFTCYQSIGSRMTKSSPLLEAPVEEVLRQEAPERVRRAEAALKRAEATGADSDVATYVRESLNWLDDAVEEFFSGRVPAEQLARVRLLAAQAPMQAIYSAWRLRDPKRGVWLTYVDRLREIADEFGVAARPFVLRFSLSDQSRAEGSPAPSVRLLKLVSDEIAAVIGARTSLDEIRDTLDLSWPELARLFGVQRQAIEQWRVRGVPPNRSADLDRLVEACRFLKHRLKRERIAQIVRAPSERLKGKSMLDYAAEKGAAALLEHLRALFSFQLM
jgi:hypothetical protein